MTRGVLYIVWGRYNKQELQNSIDSVKRWGYDYHVCEVEDEGIGLAHKSRMMDLTPFDTTLFLDTDCTVMGNLDYGFEMAELYGICCCIAPASSCYLPGKEIGIPLHSDSIQYNTGVIFFSRYVSSLFRDWEKVCKEYPLSKNNDQPALSVALEFSGLSPYILPRNWNWRCKTRYEAKILHGDLKIRHCR